MKERLKRTLIVLLAVLLFLIVVWLFPVWIIVWIITGWSAMKFLLDFFTKNNL